MGGDRALFPPVVRDDKRMDVYVLLSMIGECLWQQPI